MSGTPQFNKDAPYGDVSGLPGVRYYQAGHHFNAQGEYLTPEFVEASQRPSRQVIETEKEARKEALKEAFKAERAAGTSVTVVEAKPARPSPAADPLVVAEGETDVVQYEELHWTKLRKLVEDAGGTYTGKDDAVAYLKAL